MMVLVFVVVLVLCLMLIVAFNDYAIIFVNFTKLAGSKPAAIKIGQVHVPVVLVRVLVLV